MRMHTHTTSLDTLLSELRAASRAPRAKHPGVGVADVQIDRAFQARLPRADRESIARSAGYRQQALSAARRNDIAAAEAAIWRAALAIDRTALSREGWLTAQTMQEAAAAYVDYRAGRFDDAWRRSEDSLAATNELYEKFAFPYALQRRVHLVANLVHMLARSGAAPGAMALAWPLFDYIEGAEDRWPLAHLRTSPPAEPWDIATRHWVSEMVIVEMAVALEQAPGETAALMAEGRRHVAATAPATCGELSRAHAWIHLQCSLADGDVESFLAGAVAFLVETAGPISPLWSYVVRDAARCCGQLGGAVATQLSGELFRLALDGPTAAKLRAAG